MKKFFLLFILATLSVFSIVLSKKETVAANKLLLENVEAMALSGEVEIEAICMGSSDICIYYPDNGFFIRGQRVD